MSALLSTITVMKVTYEQPENIIFLLTSIWSASVFTRPIVTRASQSDALERLSSLCGCDVTLASRLKYSVFAEVRAGFLCSIWV